uniref:THAP-type domain-containing protein n=1 Tax=Cacopsylla melanoneura TaxID=428564 RepID=A0A8D9B0V5_9HEMI
MPALCFAPGCNHIRGAEGVNCSFFRFPQDKVTHKKWTKACRRQDRAPKDHDRLCSCHFINCNKSNGPTLFQYNEKKYMDFKSPEKRRRIARSAPVPATSPLTTSSLNPVPSTSSLNPIPSTSSLNPVPSPSPLTTPSPNPVPSTSPPGQATISMSSTLSHNISIKEKSRAHLESEIYHLKKELGEIKKKSIGSKQILEFSMFKGNDLKISQYTGLPSSEHFLLLCELLEKYPIRNYYLQWKVEKYCLEDQLFITLMKLRLNLPHFVLADQFGCCDTTIQNIFITFLYVLHKLLFRGMMNKIPSREHNLPYSPACFASFPNTRIIIDCTEIEVAIPASLDKQKEVFSAYKQRHTFKVLVGISPNAVITFISDLYPGSQSDKAITEKCGILSHMKAGDLILCDKGFLITQMCKNLGVSVNIPPFKTNPQFTREEAIVTRQIARARIHVERAIGRMKGFRILDFIQPHLREHASKIVQVCGCLVNMQYSLLKEKNEDSLCLSQSGVK